MHYLYLVATPKKTEDSKYTNVREVQNHVHSILDDNNFCNSEGGFFSASKGDWYEIGGRWANWLCNRHEWAIKAEKEIEEYLKRDENLEVMTDEDGKKVKKPYHIKGCNYGDKAKKTKQKELRERCELIFSRNRPKDYPKVPWDRFYSPNGVFSTPENKNADCSEVLTEELAQYIIDFDEKHGKYESMEIFVEYDDYDYDEMGVKTFLTDSKTGKIDKDILGNYWITVVDYHN